MPTPNRGRFGPGNTVRLGRKHSVEARNKMSDSWDYEKHFSAETRKKISDGLKGRTFTQEHKDNISKSLVGRSNGREGIPLSAETKRKISESNTGKKHPHSEATKLAMRGRASWNKGLYGSANPLYKEYKTTPLKKLLRNHPLYVAWKKEILERDDYTCQICWVRGGILQVDHYPKTFYRILTDAAIKTMDEAILRPQLWDISNGRTLCIECHKKTPTWGNATKEGV